MRKYRPLYFLAAMLAITGILYLAASLAEASWCIAQWSSDTRGFMAFLWTCWMLGGLLSIMNETIPTHDPTRNLHR